MAALLGRGVRLEYATLGWNVVGLVVLAFTALAARSVALAGLAWTAVTAAVMFALAAGKASTGAALDNPVLRTEGRVTLVDGILATAVLAGLIGNAVPGWWWRSLTGLNQCHGRSDAVSASFPPWLINPVRAGS